MLQIHETEQFCDEVVDQLLVDYEFYPYRHYRGFGRETPKQFIRWQLLHGPETAAIVRLLAMDGSRPVGLACVVPRHWESEQLGTHIAELHHCITLGNPQTRRAIAELLLETVRQRLSGTVSCLVHRVDSDDYVTIAALEACGFYLVDTAVSLVCGREIVAYMQRAFPQRGEVRTYREEDWPAVEAIVRQRKFQGRFYNDPRFDKCLCDELYVEWARLCAEGIFADEMVVALRNGKVGGFLGHRWQRWMEKAAGIRVRGQGLLAVGTEYKGLVLEVIRGSNCQDGSAIFRQFDIQLNNLEFLTLLNRGLRLDVAHVRHVFHGWLDTMPELQQHTSRGAIAGT